MTTVSQISISTVAQHMTQMEKVTDGTFVLSFLTPYTRRCCDVYKSGQLLGRRYTPKTVMQLISVNR